MHYYAGFMQNRLRTIMHNLRAKLRLIYDKKATNSSIRRVSGIRQRSHNIGDDEPPFVVVQSATDFATLEQRHADLKIVAELTYFLPPDAAANSSSAGPCICVTNWLQSEQMRPVSVEQATVAEGLLFIVLIYVTTQIDLSSRLLMTAFF